MSFNVLDYSPQLWLDARSISTIVLNGSGKVLQWNDKSGHGRNFYTVNLAEGGLLPSYEKGKIIFDRTATSATSPTQCCVMSNSSTGSFLAGNKSIFVAVSEVAGGGGILFGQYGVTSYFGFYANEAYSRSGTIYSVGYALDADYHVISSKFIAGTSMAVWLDGVAKGSTSFHTFDSPTCYLGVERPPMALYPATPFKGTLHEIIICDALNDTQRVEIETYLMNRWGGSLSGTVYERVDEDWVAGAFPVYLYDRVTGELVESTTSGADGAYSFVNIAKDECYVVALDNREERKRAAVTDKAMPI